jgi:hypothetical protein
VSEEPVLRLVETHAARLLVHEDFERAARALEVLDRASLERLWRDHADSRPDASRGRAATIRIAVPVDAVSPGATATSETLLLKHLRHGGLWAKIAGAHYASLRRPFDELRATARLRARGAAVPRAAFAVGHRSAAGSWRATVATVEIPRSRDGASWLAAEPSSASLLRVARSVGSAVRRLHDLGARHPDLHIANILIENIGPNEERIWIVDLDRVRVGEPPRAGRRLRELMRLYRSLVKRGFQTRVGDRGTAAFFAGYCLGDRDLRRAMLKHARLERARVGLHRLGYGLARR